MKYLGIESTAHTLGIGEVDGGEIAANEKEMYEPQEGGFEPRKAAEHHYKSAKELLQRVENAGFTVKDADRICFSQGPGIRQSLDVGSVIAKTLSKKHKTPLIGVNHCAAHISIGRTETGAQNPVTLYVSGGNTQIITTKKGFNVAGETLDIAIGNALDKLARSMGISYPGGPEIERLASKTEKILESSYPMKGMDFSFSGLVTELKRKSSPDRVKANSFQEHAFGALVEGLERALAQSKSDEVLLTGGVAMNDRLREMVEKMCDSRGADCYFPSKQFCMDNGAMIADRGRRREASDLEDLPNSGAPLPNWRPDQI